MINITTDRSPAKVKNNFNIGPVSYELSLLKLFMGYTTISFKNKNYVLLDNYTNLADPIQKQDCKTITGFCSSFEIDCSYLERHFKTNLCNTEVYKSLFNEIALALIYMRENRDVEAFLHIYRYLEKMSIVLPLVYAKTQTNYSNALSFFKDVIIDKDIQELKFYKNFQKIIMTDSELALSLSIEFKFDGEEKVELTKLYNQCIKGIINDSSLDGDVLNIKYKDIHDLIIGLRNRFFHLKIENRKNIETRSIDMNDFFKACNPIFINWLGYSYFFIIKKCIGNL